MSTDLLRSGGRRARLRAFTYYAVIAVLAFGGTVLASIITGRQASDADAWLVKTLVILTLVAIATGFFLRARGSSLIVMVLDRGLGSGVLRSRD